MEVDYKISLALQKLESVVDGKLIEDKKPTAQHKQNRPIKKGSGDSHNVHHALMHQVTHTVWF